MHLPTTARRPISSSASKTTSVSCTVSIVSAVVAAEESSAAARRAEARSVAGVWAAYRPDPRPQPREQRHVVGVAAEERLAQVHVRLDEAGEEVGASGIDDRVVALRQASPTETIRRRSRTDTAPCTMSSASFMVRMVAFRIRVDTGSGDLGLVIW
jgi:hypothetical protein